MSDSNQKLGSHRCLLLEAHYSRKRLDNSHYSPHPFNGVRLSSVVAGRPTAYHVQLGNESKKQKPARGRFKTDKASLLLILCIVP